MRFRTGGIKQLILYVECWLGFRERTTKEMKRQTQARELLLSLSFLFLRFLSLRFHFLLLLLPLLKGQRGIRRAQKVHVGEGKALPSPSLPEAIAKRLHCCCCSRLVASAVPAPPRPRPHLPLLQRSSRKPRRSPSRPSRQASGRGPRARSTQCPRPRRAPERTPAAGGPFLAGVEAELLLLFLLLMLQMMMLMILMMMPQPWEKERQRRWQRQSTAPESKGRSEGEGTRPRWHRPCPPLRSRRRSPSSLLRHRLRLRLHRRAPPSPRRRTTGALSPRTLPWSPASSWGRGRGGAR
jgi:hypothetical protein